MKKIFKTWTASWTVLLLVLSLTGTSAFADRIKDLTTVAAMRSNQLIGYGLVVGLQGTGDLANATKAGWGTSVMLKLWPF